MICNVYATPQDNTPAYNTDPTPFDIFRTI